MIYKANFYIRTNTIYTYIVCKYKNNLHTLRNRRENRIKAYLSSSFLKLVQINYIFCDNVRILSIASNYNIYLDLLNYLFILYISSCLAQCSVDNLTYKSIYCMYIVHVCVVYETARVLAAVPSLYYNLYASFEFTFIFLHANIYLIYIIGQSVKLYLY